MSLPLPLSVVIVGRNIIPDVVANLLNVPLTVLQWMQHCLRKYYGGTFRNTVILGENSLRSAIDCETYVDMV